MVMIMKLKSIQWINQQPMNNASILHQFYKQKQIHIPNIKEIILDRLRFEMYIYETTKGDWIDRQEIQELSITIGLNFDELPHHEDDVAWKKLGYKKTW